MEAGSKSKTSVLSIYYRNWKGEVSWRTITPLGTVFFGSTAYHDDCWLMPAYDHEKQAERTFALKDILEIHEGEV